MTVKSQMFSDITSVALDENGRVTAVTFGYMRSAMKGNLEHVGIELKEKSEKREGDLVTYALKEPIAARTFLSKTWTQASGDSQCRGPLIEAECRQQLMRSLMSQGWAASVSSAAPSDDIAMAH